MLPLCRLPLLLGPAIAAHPSPPLPPLEELLVDPSCSVWISNSDGAELFFSFFARAWASSASNVSFGAPLPAPGAPRPCTLPLAAGFCSGLGEPHPFAGNGAVFALLFRGSSSARESVGVAAEVRPAASASGLLAEGTDDVPHGEPTPGPGGSRAALARGLCRCAWFLSILNIQETASCRRALILR